MQTSFRFDHIAHIVIVQLQGVLPENLFVNYLSRIHREEDFHFILKGLTRLLNNPLIQVCICTSPPTPLKKILS